MAAPRAAFIPDEQSLICPISLEVMKRPVKAGDGFTYEQNEIIRWMERNSKLVDGVQQFLSPVSGEWCKWTEPVLDKSKQELITAFLKNEEGRRYYCPISGQLMKDPVIAADGFSYERSSISDRFQRNIDISPVTHEKLAHLELKPNLSLRSAIHSFQERLGMEEKKASVKEKQAVVPPVKKLIDTEFAMKIFDMEGTGNIPHPRFMSLLAMGKFGEIDHVYLRNRIAAIDAHVPDLKDPKNENKTYTDLNQSIRDELKTANIKQANAIRIPPEFVECFAAVKDIPYGPSSITGNGALKGVATGADWELPPMTFAQAKNFVLTFARNFAAPDINLFEGLRQQPFQFSTQESKVPRNELNENDVWEPQKAEEIATYGIVKSFLRIQKSQSDQASGEKYRPIFTVKALLDAIPGLIARNKKLEPYIRGSLAPRLRQFVDEDYIDEFCDMQGMQPDIYMRPLRVTSTHVHVEIGGYNPADPTPTTHLILFQDISGSENDLDKEVLAEYKVSNEQRELLQFIANYEPEFKAAKGNFDTFLASATRTARLEDKEALEFYMQALMARQAETGLAIMEEKNIKAMYEKFNSNLPTSLFFAKQALHGLREKYMDQSNIRIHLLAFNEQVNKLVSGVLADSNDLENAINNLRADGNTCVLPLMDAVVAICKQKKPNERVMVAGSTDGGAFDIKDRKGKTTVYYSAEELLTEARGRLVNGLGEGHLPLFNVLGYKINEIASKDEKERATKFIKGLPTCGADGGKSDFVEDYTRFGNSIHYMASVPESKGLGVWNFHHETSHTDFQIPVQYRTTVREVIAIPHSKCPALPDSEMRVIKFRDLDADVLMYNPLMAPAVGSDDPMLYPSVTQMKMNLRNFKIDYRNLASIEAHRSELIALRDAAKGIDDKPLFAFLKAVLDKKFVRTLPPKDIMPDPDYIPKSDFDMGSKQKYRYTKRREDRPNPEFKAAPVNELDFTEYDKLSDWQSGYAVFAEIKAIQRQQSDKLKQDISALPIIPGGPLARYIPIAPAVSESSPRISAASLFSGADHADQKEDKAASEKRAAQKIKLENDILMLQKQKTDIEKKAQPARNEAKEYEDTIRELKGMGMSDNNELVSESTRMHKSAKESLQRIEDQLKDINNKLTQCEKELNSLTPEDQKRSKFNLSGPPA